MYYVSAQSEEKDGFHYLVQEPGVAVVAAYTTTTAAVSDAAAVQQLPAGTFCM